MKIVSVFYDCMESYYTIKIWLPLMQQWTGIETLKNFIKRISEPLHKQILEDNILIYDSGKFVNLLSRVH